LERIQGGGMGSTKCGSSEEVKAVPTLQNVLDCGSNRIYQKNDEIRAILDDISAILF
jgi:hypothetical protein